MICPSSPCTVQVEEARATEWTKIDEALKRAKRFDRMQERVYERQEVIRDRQR